MEFQKLEKIFLKPHKDSLNNKKMENHNGANQENGNGLDIEHIKKKAEIIEFLVQIYFSFEKEKVEDSVPKSVMFSMVNYMRDEAQEKLFAEMFKSNLDELFKESKECSERRSEAEHMLKALEDARYIIDGIIE